MILGGFQKFSLLDYPGKISSIIFTQGCNFNCVYCHNKDLIRPKEHNNIITPEQVLDFLKERKKKIDAVVITGGEPTLQPDLIDFMKKIKKMGFLLKLDTNGYRPDVVRKAVNTKVVDYIAMDVKAPLEKYWLVTNVSVHTDRLQESINIIKNSGIRHEFRTTVLKSLLGESDLKEIRKLIGGSELFLQKCNFPDQMNYNDEEFTNFQNNLKCGLR